MKTFLLVLLLVVVLAVILPFAYFYWRFHQSPAKLWKTRLFRLRDELYARRRVLMTGSAEPASELRRMAEEYFKAYLSGIPASALAEFPGIGPVTVEKLRQVGLKSVADLPGFVFESVPGIGPAKGAELRSALAAVVDQCRSKFDAGACKEGQDYRAAAVARSAERRRKDQADLREVTAIDVALTELDPLFTRAAGVTLAKFVRRKPHGVPDEMLAAPLPVVRVPDVVPPPPVVPQPPSPSLTVAPALARNGPTQVVLPPRGRGMWVPAEPKDLFEDMLGQSKSKPSAATSTEPAGLAAMKALARFGFLIAKADGRIAQAERRTVREYLEHKFGGDPVLVRYLDVTMEEVEKAIPTEADAVAGVRAGVPEKEWMEVYAWAELISDASGERNAKELELLARVRSALGVTVSRDTKGSEPAVEIPALPVASRLTPAPTVDPRTLLDITTSTELSVELIRRRYALLSEKLDPAKAAAMGAEFAAMAADKRAKLKAAAEELLTPFGEPLEKPTALPSSELRPNQDLDDAFGM